jgi:holo-[acyl-carrier protein] synthase
MTKKGIGVDIFEIDRMQIILEGNQKKMEKIFTSNELSYCLSKLKPSQHLAARFAGKEAVIKAINAILEHKLSLNQIEILNDSKGMPVVKIHDKKFNDLIISISLSHTEKIATAMVFAEVS